MADPRRTTITITFVLVTIASAYFLQSVFVRSDHEKGLRIARTYSAGGDSLEQVLVRLHPGASLAWKTKITSGCYGVVRSSALVVPSSGPAVEYAFDVDIPRLKVTAANPAAEAILKEVQRSARAEPTTPPALRGDGGAR